MPAVLFVMFFQYVPESPKWLVSKNRTEEAYVTLTSIRPDNYDPAFIRREIENMMKDNVLAANTNRRASSKDNLKLVVGTSVGGDDNEATWREVFSYRKAVIIGCGLMFFQTMTGINSVIFYSTTIFTFAGFDESILGTAAVTLVNFIATIFSAYYVDKMGRKFLLTVGTFTMLVALIVLSSVLISIGGKNRINTSKKN